jgi:predicted transcriptional regulator
MKLRTKLRITPVTENCRVEFQYLYVWNEPYKIVDASYLALSSSKKYSLLAIEEFVYKLWYINPNCSYSDIVSHIVDILKIKSTKGIYVTETEVYDLVYKIMNSNIPSNISELVTSKFLNKKRIDTTKIIEWKSDINSLLKITDPKILESIKNNDGKVNLSNEYKKIKLKYMKKCLDQVKSINHQEVIELTIDLLRDKKNKATIGEISQASGLSYVTTKKYINLMSDRLNFIEGFKVVKDKNKENSEETIKKLINTKEEMYFNNIPLTKTNLSKISKISRPTIDKYWGII